MREGKAIDRVIAALKLGAAGTEELSYATELATKTVNSQINFLRTSPRQVRIAKFAPPVAGLIWRAIYEFGTDEDAKYPTKPERDSIAYVAREKRKAEVAQQILEPQTWCSSLFHPSM